MSSMVDKAIARSVDALRRQDVELARQVMSSDVHINQQRWLIEERALLLLATQAPMARDLRVISTVIHISTELERMADHAAGNAKITVETANEPLLKPIVDLPRMGDLAREMLRDSITAFINEDEASALFLDVRPSREELRHRLRARFARRPEEVDDGAASGRERQRDEVAAVRGE